MSALQGLKVVELSSERGAFAGKLLADMGADVIVVEPPGGDASRGIGPFLEDRPGPERSLFWWHYNTSKRGVTLDVEREAGRAVLRKLIGTADVFLESEDPGRLASLSLDYPDLRALREDLIHVALTPFGRTGPRCMEPATDLTILAGGGPVWMCGYDDHSLPPVRGGGNQGYQTGCHYAVLSVLVALEARDELGLGQFIDVNMHAAANVTTEAGSYEWLVCRQTVQRQTGRHAAAYQSLPTQIRCADGRWVTTGLPPRQPRDFASLRDWVRELGLEEEFPEVFLLDMGAKGEVIDLSKIASDEQTQAIFGAGREAMNLVASRLPAYEFFRRAQDLGLPCGIIYAPEEALLDEHFEARGFQVEVEHPEQGRSFVYPGAPYRFADSPWAISRRAPLVGEHNAEVFAALALSEEERAALG